MLLFLTQQKHANNVSKYVQVDGFVLPSSSLLRHNQYRTIDNNNNNKAASLLLQWAVSNNNKGFGNSNNNNNNRNTPKENKNKKKNKKTTKQTKRLADAIVNNDTRTAPSSFHTRNQNGHVQQQQQQQQDHQELLLEQLAQQSATTPIGQVVAQYSDTIDDPFWSMLPSLIASKFPHAQHDSLNRIAGFVQHTLQVAAAHQNNDPPPRPIDWVEHDNDIRYRPYTELHAYMPGLGPTVPFLDPDTLPLCQLLQANYETIRNEYYALLQHQNENKNIHFQSVTSMNYQSGWQTLVLFYNGHRIPNFPYHLCPVTTQLLEGVPLAGRIAGFNRQQPRSGIPAHTDGNNMWLTVQMGIHVPKNKQATITVANETKSWRNGHCLVYDTTYIHETYNGSKEQERIVLHVDMFNVLKLTDIEIEILQYLYEVRETFLKAQGVSKVGAHIL